MEQKREYQPEEEFLAELGQRYTEQQREARERLADLKAPKALDEWAQKFSESISEQEEAAADMAATLPESVVSEKTRSASTAVTAKKSNRMRILKRVAVFAIILIGVGALGATISAEAFPFKLWRIFTRDEGTNVAVNNTDEMHEIDYYLSSDWYGFYCPAYLPEGYELASEKVQNRTGKLIFKNGEKELTFYIVYADTTALLDTEKASYQQAQIEDKELYYSNSKETQTATGYIESYTIKICYSDMDDREIEKIFKNLKKFLKI